MPTCGNCKEHHDTVQQVKDCYGHKTAVTKEDANVFMATNPQLRYIKILLEERDMSPLPEPPGLSIREASEMIQNLKKIPVTADEGQAAKGGPVTYDEPPPLPREVLFSDGEDFEILQARPKPQKPKRMDDMESAFRTSPQAAAWNIPAGYYAIPSLTGNNDLDFYRVDRPTEGRWVGYTFVKMVVGGKPAMSVRGKQRLYDILSAIQKDPERSAWLYGVEIGRCDKCNHTLTDKTSREHGRGPDCRAKYGPGHLAKFAA